MLTEIEKTKIYVIFFKHLIVYIYKILNIFNILFQLVAKAVS